MHFIQALFMNKPKHVDTDLIIDRTELTSKNALKYIDFVLVSKKTLLSNKEYIHQNIFLQNLKNRGFEIQIRIFSADETIEFFLLHLPDKMLLHYAKIFVVEPFSRTMKEKGNSPKPIFRCFHTPLTLGNLSDPIYHQMTISIHTEQFTSADRGLISYYILNTTRYDINVEQFGIDNLIEMKVFYAAYPLHDGPYKWKNEEPWNDRQLLYKFWSDCHKYKYQPVNLIRKYYGNGVAFYFAWFGLYNKMLFFCALFSLVFIIINMISSYGSVLELENEICNSNKMLCPRCYEEECRFEKLKNYCIRMHLLLYLSNTWITALSFLVSIWAVVYVKMWSRKESELQLIWNLQSVEIDVSTRPRFETKTNYRRISSLTGVEEAYVPRMVKFYKQVISISAILFLMTLLCLILFTIIVYTTVITIALNRRHIMKNYPFLWENAFTIASVSASCISFIIIILFQLFYYKISYWLTQIENPRTQTDFDNSYVYKMFTLSFVNNYAVAFYLAFIKGRFYTYPGDKSLRTVIGTLRSNYCDPSGCIVNLSSHLFIILFLKSMVKVFMQYSISKIIVMFKKRKAKKNGLDETLSWECDYVLRDYNKYQLMEEFSEMVIQYGFIIFFIAAFPWAPVLAIVMNTFEIRIDAKKFTKRYRRPVAFKVRELGAWNKIIKTMTFLGVITNAFTVAFASELIPREYYKYKSGSSLRGYMNYSLSEFQISEFELKYHGAYNETICYYPGYRYPSSHRKKYMLTHRYWTILALRLIAVVIFEHLVLLFNRMLSQFIPDMPHQVTRRLHYEKLKEKKNRIIDLENQFWGKTQQPVSSTTYEPETVTI